MSKRSPQLLLEDIVEGANKILLYTAGLSFEQFLADGKTVDAVVRNFEIIGEAVDGAKAIEEAQRLERDVVVMNVNMPVLNGLEAAREISTKLPQSAIVILSVNADKRLIEEAKKIGARAYVAKSKAAEALIKAIEAAIAGGDFVLVA